MSKLDMYPYIPKKPLADGDNLYNTKQVSNKYRIIIKWLLNNSIDHKLSIVDSDTDWNDIDNLSVYRFNSVEGPHAPEETEIGGTTGIVIGTSAGTGEHFQIAFTANGAAFRTLHSEWFYIGHGIPADVDVSKLVDQESLGKALQNYYTKPETDEITNQIYDFIEGNYYNKPAINKFRSRQARVDSLQDNQLQNNRNFTTQISSIASYKASSNASNIAVNSSDINSLSSSTKSGISSNASNEYLNSSDITSLSYSTSSSLSRQSSEKDSEIKVVDEKTVQNSYGIDSNSGNINYLNNSLKTDYSNNSENITNVSSIDSEGISSNGSNIASVSNVASEGRSYNFSYFTSTTNSANVSMNSMTSIEFSDASISGSSYQSYIINTSSYSTNPAFTDFSKNTSAYTVLGSDADGLQPQNYESKANSLAELNYNNTSVLASYVFDATHWNSVESTGDGKNAGYIGTPLKEAVESNSVNMNSETTSLADNERKLFPLYNMSLENKNGHVTIGSSSIEYAQYSGQSNALGSIYANASNNDMLASGINTNTDSISSVSGSTDSRADSGDIRFNSGDTRFNSGDIRFGSDETSTINRFSGDESNATKRFSSGDSRDSSEENSISQNNNILTNFVGFIDSQHKPELDHEIFLCTANGARTEPTGRTGKVVGWFVINNPRDPSLANPNQPSVYSIATLDSNNYIQGNQLAIIWHSHGPEHITSFHGGDGFIYQSTWCSSFDEKLHGNIDFSQQQLINEMTCRLVDKNPKTKKSQVQEVQTSQVSYLSKPLASAVGNIDTPFGSTVASVATSVAEYVAGQIQMGTAGKDGTDGYNPWNS